MDRSGNLYMYLECLKAAVETEGVFACDEDGHLRSPAVREERNSYRCILTRKLLRDLNKQRMQGNVAFFC